MQAIAVPLLADKVDAWKAWLQECMGSRRDQFEEFNQRMGLTTHRAWLTESPQGAMAIVVTDGPGTATFIDKLAKSDHAFDTWFRNSISEYHGIDFSQGMPGPMPERLLDWSKQAATV